MEQPANKPKVVCLCGSSRWPELHHQAMMAETLAGNIVLPLGLYGHADYPPGAKAVTNDSDEATPVKQMLDRMHLQKIDLADEVVVVSENGRVGSSTQREIDYAKQKGKPVRFWVKPSTPAPVSTKAPARVCQTCGGDKRGVWHSVGCTTFGSYRTCPDCHGKPLPEISKTDVPAHPDLAVFDRKVTPLPIEQRRILMWADNSWLLCDWLPRTETSKADKGYLGTARTVEQSVHTGYHAWEQNDSEFRFFCLPPTQ